MDFTIIEDFEGYPTAILKGHVMPVDTGYNSRIIHCRCDVNDDITEAVNRAMDNETGVIGSMPG